LEGRPRYTPVSGSSVTDLDAAGQVIGTNPEAARALLYEARDASVKALAELRALVRGIHPPVLADRGLADAIRALALDAPARIHLASDLEGRPPAPVESAADQPDVAIVDVRLPPTFTDEGIRAALSPREREVLALMAEGRSNAAIAQRLVITERAVAKHTASIFLKLDLQPSDDDNRRVLAVLAYLGG